MPFLRDPFFAFFLLSSLYTNPAAHARSFMPLPFFAFSQHITVHGSDLRMRNHQKRIQHQHVLGKAPFTKTQMGESVGNGSEAEGACSGIHRREF